MTTFLGRFPFPPPFDKNCDPLNLPRERMQFFEHILTIDEPVEWHHEDSILMDKVLELGVWAKDMEEQNPDLELVDAQLIFRPKYGKLQPKAMLGAKIMMKKMNNKEIPDSSTV